MKQHLAEKYGVSEDRIVLDADGEHGKEVDEEDIKSLQQVKRENKEERDSMRGVSKGKVKSYSLSEHLLNLILKRHTRKN